MLTSYFRLIYNRASHESLFLSLCDVSSPSHEFLITVPGFLRSSHLYQGKILFYFAHFCPFYVTHIWCSVLKSCLSLEIPRTPGFLVVTISWCAVYLVAAVCSNSCSLSRWCYLTISSFCPLLLLPSIFPNIRVFSNESALHIRWPKYWSFSFNINPSNEHPGLISFRMDWLDLLPVQGTLKSLLQHHSSKVSIFWRSAFFIVQLSYWYMPIGKTIALTLFPSLQVQEARF